MNFNHFILTRFNIKGMFDNITKDKHNVEVLTRDWLSHRFKLFENYCFPSIINQRNKNFKWLIYFDKNTDERYKNKIQEFKSNHPFFYPIFVENSSHMFSTYKNDIENIICNPSDYIITTRLDNDDCLSANAIDTIQRQFNNQDFVVINFLYGYVYDIKRNLFVMKYQYSNPLGISIIEKYRPGLFKTVWCDEHGKLSKFNKMIDIVDDKYWLQLIHDRNVKNDILEDKKKYLPVLDKKIESSFGISYLPRSIIYYIIFLIRYIIYKLNKKITRYYVKI